MTVLKCLFIIDGLVTQGVQMQNIELLWEDYEFIQEMP